AKTTPSADVSVAENAELVDPKQRCLFEDLDLSTDTENAGVLAELADFLSRQLGLPVNHIKPRLALTTDTIFSFLVENATEIVTHVTLKFETKTALEKHLRNEEAVPAEAVFLGLAVSTRGD